LLNLYHKLKHSKGLTTILLISVCLGITGFSCLSPTEPKSGDCPPETAPCFKGSYVTPSYYDSLSIQRKADARVQKALNEGKLIAWRGTPDFNSYPAVAYVDCFFWVDNAVWSENGKQVYGSACAAGCTKYEDRTLKIALQDGPARTAALVDWEQINYRLLQMGRSDLVDVWQSSYYDPKAPVH
jgi:hypothetical protein